MVKIYTYRECTQWKGERLVALNGRRNGEVGRDPKEYLDLLLKRSDKEVDTIFRQNRAFLGISEPRREQHAVKHGYPWPRLSV